VTAKNHRNPKNLRKELQLLMKKGKSSWNKKERMTRKREKK